MLVYFVGNSAVRDPALLEEYSEGVRATLGIVPLRVLAGDKESVVVEGEPAGTRTVILEFQSEADFRTWYDSPEYQAVLHKRLAATSGFGVLARGV